MLRAYPAADASALVSGSVDSRLVTKPSGAAGKHVVVLLGCKFAGLTQIWSTGDGKLIRREIFRSESASASRLEHWLHFPTKCSLLEVFEQK